MNKSKRKKVTKFIGLAILFGLLLGALSATLFVVSALKNLPSLELITDRQVAQSTKIYDKTGETLLFELFDEERRTLIPFEKIPERVKQATVAIEDANFYEHSALDIKGLFRAALINAKSGRIEQGGSTITQQLAKNAFLTREQTLPRKIKELIIAYRLEQVFTKDEILGLYLNQIPYGSNAYGIESASQTYFNKPVEEVSLAEAAALVSIPRGPSLYSPYGNNIDLLFERKDKVLREMFNLGNITQEEYELALEQEIEFAPRRRYNLELGPHFVIQVKEYLEETYGEEFVRRGGLTVITTLDVELQEFAQAAVEKGAERNEELYEGKNAALVAQDPETGKILALVGSRDYFNEEIDGAFNVASQGLRQPGSTLKPFAYLAAMEDRGLNDKTVLFDVETEFNTTNDPEESYKPKNYDGLYRGPIAIRNALAESINVPAVKTLYIVGIQNFIDFLGDFGINTLNDPRSYGLSLVLGGGEVHLTELVNSYATLAQEGIRHKQHLIERIEDQNGNIIEEYKDVATRVVNPENPRIINNILSDINARAKLLSSSLNLTIFPGHDLALKTGTTNDYRDAWSVGYTPTLVVGVWAGNSDNTPMQQRGGSILAAIPMLSDFLSDALPQTPARPFPSPDPVTSNVPMIDGEHIAYYQGPGGQVLPQVHNILFYLDRLGIRSASDKQFDNWEQAVLAWAQQHIPNFVVGQTYNQELPSGSTRVSAPEIQSQTLNILNPAEGSFIQNGEINLQVSATGGNNSFSRIDIIFNGTTVDTLNQNFGNTLNYNRIIRPATINAQNTLSVRIMDTGGRITQKDIILYQ